MRRVLALIAYCCSWSPMFALAQGAPETIAEKEVRREILLGQAKTIRANAEKEYQRTTAECQQRVFVNQCIGGAKDERLRRIEEARRIEIEGDALARELKRAELAERRARKAQARAERQPAVISVEGGAPPAGAKPAAK